jgi:hypothetical protein
MMLPNKAIRTAIRKVTMMRKQKSYGVRIASIVMAYYVIIRSRDICQFSRGISVLTEKGEPMYKSPIEILTDEVNLFVNNEVFTACQRVGVNVDKDELIRALQYDRNQYEKGYADGHRDALDSLVRCKDCKRWKYDTRRLAGLCERHINYTAPYEFCSCGERRDVE